MADTEGNLDAKQFRPDVPQEMAGFHVKGAGSLDFGMKHRLGRIFRDGACGWSWGLACWPPGSWRPRSAT